MSPAFHHLRGLLGAAGDTDVSDGGLLERFASHRDEAAFAELLRRHGAMVLSVCNSLLHQTQDAEDAFQATFLVLVRRAKSLQQAACLGNWLYGVACRTARTARRSFARRQAHERQARERRLAMLRTSESGETPSGETPTTPELPPGLCEEVERLPDKYRAPLLLCYFQGKTNEEAAHLLGCPKGTVLSRLSRARDKLRSRLVRRGVTLSAAGLTTALTNQVLTAAPPAALLASTTKAASLVATGNAGAAGLAVTALTEGVLQAMFREKMRNAAIVVICVLLAATGLTFLWTRAAAQDGLPPEQAAKSNATPQPSGKEGERPQQETKSKTEPAGVPLEARLVTKKDSYVLDLGGKTPEEFRKGIKDINNRYPATPAVDLELEFRNSGDKEFTFLVGGSYPDIPLLLKLEGPGAVNVTMAGLSAPIARGMFTQVKLAPGKTYTLPIKSLMTNRLGRDGTASYWLEPGDYTLTATYQTGVSPAPPGSKDGGNFLGLGFGYVTVTTAPVKLRVTREQAMAIPSEFRKALGRAETLELYSLDPRKPALKDEATFHEWKVLGKTEVKGESLTKLLAALKQGVDEADQNVSAGCYRPRHGLRATVDGKSYDFVICFECVLVLIYGASAEKNAGFHVSHSPAQTFNRILTDAMIALPKQPDED
jgi:RNA polymerase sigma factor (sigma-70 family)